MNKYTISPIAIAALVVLTGCATQSIERTESQIAAQMVDIQHTTDAVRPKKTEFVQFNPGSYIPLKRIEKSEFTVAQKRLLASEIAINRNFSNLNDIASWLTSVVGSPVFLNPEILSQLNTATPTAGAVMGAMPGVPSAPGATQSTGTAAKPLEIIYSGSITGFLDIVASNYGIFWKMDDSNIRLLLTDSRTFRIKALPGASSLSSTVGGASNTATSGSGTSTSTGSGSATNTAGISFSSMSVWTDIESGIKQLLTPSTGRVAVNPATGTVTVTDTPRVLERVAEFIKDQNASLSKQVAVNVRVLSVEINDGENYGINWNAVYNNLASNAAFSLTSAFPVAAGGANFVLQTANQSGSSWSSSSGAIISALSTQGRVSEMTSATVLTLNNQPAPVNVGRQTSYLASSSTTTTTGAGNTTTLTPGQVQTGFSMVLIPHILDGREMLVQTSINLSSLLKLDTVSSGGSSIQSPDLTTSNFIQRVRLKSGDTIVAAGFDQDNLSAVSNGVGAAKNNLMGSQKSTGKRSILVILIQPTIAN
jgi:type IVB pilus formation R64 PilN family outer membrane protein